MPTRPTTWEYVRQACRFLAEQHKPLTVKAVAEKAGIARATIYNDRKLRRFVEQYEVSFHYQKGKAEEARTGYAAGYQAGFAAGQAARPAHRAPAGSQDWARGVLHIDPKEPLTARLIKQRFRELSQFLHPDRGGRNDRQQALNAAYEILKYSVGE